jgi:16S rRNA (uracil1498-N3)-methyltransferase
VTPRFFVSPDAIADDLVRLDGDAAHRIARVLRLQAGDRVELCDGSGIVYLVELTDVSQRLSHGKAIGKRQPRAESAIPVVLYQAVVRERRMAWLLEKVTEIGVARIVPLITARTVRARNSRVDAPRLRRWRRIVREAAEQSRRTRLPEVAPAMSIEDACGQCDGPALICDAGGKARPLLDAVAHAAERHPATVSLFVGPEGGFTPEEIGEAARSGIEPVTLGRRILRAETAGIVASALTLAALQERDEAATEESVSSLHGGANHRQVHIVEDGC